MIIKCTYKIFVSLLIVAATLFTPLSSVYACTCAQPPSPSIALQHSEAVFSGRVKEIRPSRMGYQVVFEVNNTWKGVNQSQLLVSTGIGDGGGDCGFPFTEGSSYLVYADLDTMDRFQGSLVVTSCSRTAIISEAKKDIDELGLGKPPLTQVNLISLSYDLYILTMLGAILFIGIISKSKHNPLH